MIRPILVGTALGALALGAVAAPSGAAERFVADARPAQAVDFTVHVPLRNAKQLDQLIVLQTNAGSPLYHHFLTPTQFRASFGASPATVASVAGSLQKAGFAVHQNGSQLLQVRGTAATVEAAFSARLGVAVDANGRHTIAARTALHVPSALAAVGASVAGLTAAVQPRPMYERALAAPANRYSTVGPYWFDDLKQAYNYPSYEVANGRGVTVATVGNSDFSSSDADAYFAHEKLGKGGLAPAPVIDHLVLPGGAPFDPTTGISDEANLDTQMVGGSAPGAHVIGVAIGGPGEAFLNAYAYLDEANRADIVSTSYGACELFYLPAYNNGIDQTSILYAYHDLFRQGNSQGITFIFSSGDQSGLGCAPPGYITMPKQGKAYPAIPGAGIWVDDPNVTSVGGTNLITQYQKGSLNSAYIMENSIGDRLIGGIDFYGTGNTYNNALWGSGSGTSVIFPKPNYQNKIPTGGGKMRIEPDVSMHMGGCPGYAPPVKVECGRLDKNGFPIRDSADLAVIGGQLFGLIGTSASAPEFAGLLAVKESVIKSRLGNENEDLYTLAASNATGHYFRQGFEAYNGVVHTTPSQLGYNPIVGVGTPIGNNFVLLPKAPLAGLPQTASNP